jgi:hypothetical protein
MNYLNSSVSGRLTQPPSGRANSDTINLINQSLHESTSTHHAILQFHRENSGRLWN